MNVRIFNEGTTPIRVILNRDNINDETLDAGEERPFETPSPGVIQLRELGGPQGDLSGDDPA